MKLVKLITAHCSHMYNSWPQMPSQMAVSISVSSLVCWVNMTFISSLYHVLSILSSAFSLLHLCTPSASSFLSPSSWLPFSFTCLCFCVCFRLLPPQAISLQSLLSSFCPFPQFIVRKLLDVSCARDEDYFLLVNIIADQDTPLVWYHLRHYRMCSCSRYTDHSFSSVFGVFLVSLLMIQFMLLDTIYDLIIPVWAWKFPNCQYRSSS